MHPTRLRRLRTTSWAWWLFATIPLGVVAGGLCVVYSGISLCGVFGCSGVYAPTYGPDVQWVVPAVLAGVFVTLGLAAPPWLLPHWLRWLIAAIPGTALSAYLIVTGFDEKYPLIPLGG